MNPSVSAVVLAAGLSRRMGSQKLLLPWNGRTVIAQVVATLLRAGLEDIVVVTGAQAAEVGRALSDGPARCVHNPLHANGEMIDSIRTALTALSAPDPIAGEGSSAPLAALLCLGDQPQMEAATVCAVLTAAAAAGWSKVVIPSYQMRAGHPILLPAAIWPAILATPATLRDVLQAERTRIEYLAVPTPSVLADLDTPEDYRRAIAHEQQSKAID